MDVKKSYANMTAQLVEEHRKIFELLDMQDRKSVV